AGRTQGLFSAPEGPMPFIAECTFCKGKVRVPDTSAGLGMSCPRCGNFFTLAATTSASAPPPRITRNARHEKAEAPRASVDGPAPPAGLAAQSARNAAPPEDHVEAVPQPEPALPPLPLPPVADGPEPPGAKYLDPVGVVALLLGSGALVLAQFSSVDFL